jgi:hypothetical protein
MAGAIDEHTFLFGIDISDISGFCDHARAATCERVLL